MINIVTVFLKFSMVFFLAAAQVAAGAPREWTEERRETLFSYGGGYSNEALMRLLGSELRFYITGQATKSGNYILKLDSVIDSEMFEQNEWENEWKNEFIYDDHWRPLEIIEKTWDPGSGSWELHGKSELTYDADGQLTRLLFLIPGNNGETLSPDSRIDVYYSAVDKIDFVEVYEYMGDDQWDHIAVMEFEYTPEGLLSQVETSIYVEEYEEWKVEVTNKFTYDEHGRRTISDLYIYIEGEDDPILYSRTEHTYNEQGRLVRTERSNLSFFTFELEPEQKIEYTYDDDGNMTMSVWYERLAGGWVEEYMEEFFYDPDYEFSDAAFPFTAFALLLDIDYEETIEPDFHKLPIESLGYDYIDNDFVLADRSELFYSAIHQEEYTLTYIAGENGTITGETTQTVEHGGDGTEVEAVPDEGHHFLQWSDGLETAKRQDTNVTEDITVTASFSVNIYTIEAQPNNEDFGTVEGAGDYEYGQTVSLIASPAEGHHFVNWTENGQEVHNEQTYEFTAEENRELVANFAVNVYTIEAQPNNEDFGTVEGAGEYEHGQAVTLTAIPAEGAYFVNWTENGQEVHNEQTYEFTAEENRELVANFEQTSYTLAFEVTDASTGEDIPDATVTLDGTEHGAGEYLFENLVPGSYSYQVKHQEYFDESGEVEITDEDVSLVIELQKDDTSVLLAEEVNISVFPNPASSRINIEAGTIINEVHLIDMIGVTVMHTLVNDKNHTLNVAGLKDGLYFIQVVTEAGTKTKRVQIVN